MKEKFCFFNESFWWKILAISSIFFFAMFRNQYITGSILILVFDFASERSGDIVWLSELNW